MNTNVTNLSGCVFSLWVVTMPPSFSICPTLSMLTGQLVANPPGP